MIMEKKSSAAVVFPVYSVKEEILNSMLHGFGVLAAIAGLVLLSLKAGGTIGGHRADSLEIVAAVIFTATMIGMFLASTLYHGIQNIKAKNILRKIDHSVIFIFIAGTYTPFCLVGLEGGGWGWSIFGIQWFLAITGITLNVINYTAFRKVSMVVYIMMGWVIAVGFVPLFRLVEIQSIIPLVIGGILYTAGTFWYRKKDVKHSHAVWHSFVLLGALCHWYAIWRMF